MDKIIDDTSDASPGMEIVCINIFVTGVFENVSDRINS